MDGAEIGRIDEETDIGPLLDRAAAGDEEAFMEIVGLYQRKVFVLAYAILRDRDDALDIVQETFLKLHQKIDSFTRGRRFQNWLLQIARNLCVDYYRKNYRKRRELESAEDTTLAAAAEGGPDVERRAELRDVLARCVDGLAERQRLVFVLRHYDELRFQEISATMRISVGTAKSLHFKAVRNLKRMLEPYLGVQS